MNPDLIEKLENLPSRLRSIETLSKDGRVIPVDRFRDRWYYHRRDYDFLYRMIESFVNKSINKLYTHLIQKRVPEARYVINRYLEHRKVWSRKEQKYMITNSHHGPQDFEDFVKVYKAKGWHTYYIDEYNIIRKIKKTSDKPDTDWRAHYAYQTERKKKRKYWKNYRRGDNVHLCTSQVVIKLYNNFDIIKWNEGIRIVQVPITKYKNKMFTKHNKVFGKSYHINRTVYETHYRTRIETGVRYYSSRAFIQKMTQEKKTCTIFVRDGSSTAFRVCYNILHTNH